MGVLRQLARQLGFGPRGRSPKRAKSRRDRFEIEHLEKRCPMAADIHLGVVYYEDSLSGSDGGPDAFKVSWNGGAPGTELTHLAIYTDKEMTIGPDGKVVPGSGNGLTNGDIFFDTAAGGAGAFLSHGLTITGTNGFTVTSSSVVDGGSVILFTFSGFNAGEVLEFTIDADEVGFNNSSSAFVEGAEFEGSILDGTFSNPNYFTAQGSARFFDSFTVPNALNVPGDDYSPPNPASNETPVRTAGGFVQLTQTPKPSSIRGHVHADRDGDCEYDPGEPLLQGVQIDLLDVNGNVIATTFTDVNGEYLFDNLLPGTYGVFEHQPVGYFDGGDQIGSVGGVNSANDTVTQIVLDANVKAVDYNFCEKEPSSIAGLVYVDNGQNGVYDAGDPVIPNVKIELLNDQGAVVATTTTNSNGQYAFNNLPPGTYSVRETQPAGYYD